MTSGVGRAAATVCRSGRVVQVRCLECGADNAGPTEICARCGAPAGYQPPAAYPAAVQPAGRSRPSRLVLVTVEVAAALGVVAGLIAGFHHSGSSASSSPSTGQLTIYQLRTGDCLQDPGQTLVNFNEQGPFTVVRCTQRHTAEVFFAGNAWPRSLAYPGDEAVYEDGFALCLTAFSAYDGIDSSLSAFDVVSTTPDSNTWPGGDRRLVCFAAADAGGLVNYSIKGSHQ
jgi:hypothetical protein